MIDSTGIYIYLAAYIRKKAQTVMDTLKVTQVFYGMGNLGR